MDQSADQQRAPLDRPHRAGRPVLAFLIALAIAPALSGCQISYLISSAYHQADLLRRRVPIEDAIKDPALPEEHKRKLKLAQEARIFAESELGLKATSNYDSYVQLDRPYVTYVVNAAYKDQLKSFKWRYPMLGALPYKGYFEPDGAKAEAESLKKEGYDTYVRGVTAYSTLGWFRDPVLSSMLAYKDYDLVSTVIHETVHATIYIKSEADFNERLATFFGNKGAEAFYRKKEGPDGPTLKAMADDAHDERLFKDFMTKEIAELRKWYEERKRSSGAVPIPEDTRRNRLREIQDRFVTEVRPKLRLADSYKNFEKAELNNARLMLFRLYNESLDDFEAVFLKLGSDFHKMLEFCKSLEKADDPKVALAREAGVTLSPSLEDLSDQD